MVHKCPATKKPISEPTWSQLMSPSLEFSTAVDIDDVMIVVYVMIIILLLTMLIAIKKKKELSENQGNG